MSRQDFDETMTPYLELKYLPNLDMQQFQTKYILESEIEFQSLKLRIDRLN